MFLNKSCKIIEDAAQKTENNLIRRLLLQDGCFVCFRFYIGQFYCY